MGELACVPWRRYGHDRVYVNDGDVKVGVLDRKTGTVTVDDEAQRHRVTQALAAAGHVTQPPQPEQEPWALTLPGDTATYRAGAGARRQAEAERSAAPVRTALARVLGVHTAERAWRVGAEGEEAVARILARLGEPWLVLHDLPIGDRGSNVDHVAIGPPGVFTMNTKNLTGRVWVGGDGFLHNGQRQPYVRNARHEAARVGRLLGVPAHGLIVVMADGLTIREQPADVTVVTRREVARWLRRRSPVLDAALLARVQKAARHPDTWRQRAR